MTLGELKNQARLSWPRRFAAIDFETADYDADSACAVAVVVVEDMRIVGRYSSLLKPPRRRFRFTNIHGIRWEDVSAAPSFGEYWPTLAEQLRGVASFAAHNAPFDRNVLLACCERAGIDPPELEWLCTVRMARAAWNIRPTSLPNVCEHLGIELNHHDALSDASACAQIAIEAFRVGIG